MKVYKLENKFLKVEFISLGATIISIEKKENKTNFVLKYKDMNRYSDNVYFLGATIGRNAGRIYPCFYKNFDEEKIILKPNENDVYLHGGEEGYFRKEWIVDRLTNDVAVLSFEDISREYEKSKIKIVYKLEENNFIINYFGISERPTVFNLTNHMYFNLNKDKSETIQKHWLEIDTSLLQIIDEKFIPTGKYASMKDEYSFFNFENQKQIREAFLQKNQLSEICKGGIDLAYCFLDRNMKRPKIKLCSENKENSLTIYSNQEACVVYTLNKLEAEEKELKKFQGITFEMQKKPNFLHEEKENYLQDKYFSWIKYEIE